MNERHSTISSDKENASALCVVRDFLFEATPPNQSYKHPNDLDKWSIDKQIEYWINLQLNPQPQTRLKRIFKLINKNNELPLFVNNDDNIIDSISLRELDVLIGSGSGQDRHNHSLLKRVNNTQLHIGRATLARHLVCVKSTENLKKLQKVTAKLNFIQKNVSLSEIIKKHLKRIKDLEDTFLFFWLGEDEYDQLEQFLKQKRAKLFSKTINSWLNFSPFFIAIKMFKEVAMPIVMPIISIALSLAFCFLTHGHIIALLSAITSVPMTIIGIPKAYEMVKIQRMILLLMQRNLQMLSLYIKELKQLNKAFEGHGMPSFLCSSLQLPQTDTIEKLMLLLSKKTFTSPASFFSHWGLICVAYRLMLQCKNDFIKSYNALGSVDFICSLNTLLSSSDKKTPYCFANYHREFSILAFECWTPLLSRDTAITNNISLGWQNPRTFIITGPNARGKTTLMRSVAGAALLGSTIGISSAKKITIPENLNFLTAINIGDDPCNRLSLFQTILKRMASIKRTIKNQDKRCHLVVTDEPFIGTDKILAQACASAFIACIAQKPNSLALFSSHLDVINLEQEFPSLIANYRLAKGYKFVSGVDKNREEYYQVGLDEIVGKFGREDEFVREVAQRLQGEINIITNKKNSYNLFQTQMEPEDFVEFNH